MENQSLKRNNKGNGFTFGNYDANEMKETIENAYNLFKTNKEMSWMFFIC